jgi:putative transposase
MPAWRKEGSMTDISQIAEQKWIQARRRADVLRPLLEFKHCPRNISHEAAITLMLSERQSYQLIQQLRESDGELTALLPVGSSSGRGKQRLAAPREHLLHYLNKRNFPDATKTLSR